MNPRAVRRPCPVCQKGARDTALDVKTDERGTVEYCHRCHYTSANNHITSRGIAPAPKIYRPWQELASHLWGKSLPLRGSLAETYLLARNCMLPPEDGDLRYLPAAGEHPAAMVARITDVVTNEPLSLHFTALDASGAKQGRRLLAGHRKAGGCIRLWPDDAVTYSLGLAEGIETALSLAHGHSPVWAAVDAGNLASYPVLDGIETLIVAADHDDAGMRAAAELGRRWADAGKRVRLVMPDDCGQDVNDLVAA